MKALRWIIVVAGMALALPTQAPGGFGDAEEILYRVSGVRDNGGADNTGVATSFHCTNFSGVFETIRFVIRGANATVLANTALGLNHLETGTMSTHPTLSIPIVLS